MSAIAARVAVVPGRNAIGIELPNQTREKPVYLRELIASRDFDGNKAKLAMGARQDHWRRACCLPIWPRCRICLLPYHRIGQVGRDQHDDPVAPLQDDAGTVPPDHDRPQDARAFGYDGIPHLLSPVETDPKKAVVALKWTVREWKSATRRCPRSVFATSTASMRRVAQAQEKGEVLTRTVQTGFDRQTGEAIYETEEFDLQPIPYIVVIIDEIADLMMVACKDIEGAVQRLAQMARAAGIHVIMATQRPSVDVITGTIKANFPTRISFQVTSKIDRRTILGEQGAEQLLGMATCSTWLVAVGSSAFTVPLFPTMRSRRSLPTSNPGSPQYLEAITIDDEDDEDGGGPSGTGNPRRLRRSL